MPKMGKYCKAYPVMRFREFSGWSENLENLRKDKGEPDGKQEAGATVSDDDAFFYLQENFAVTDGIFIDENIIFNDTSPEWVDFCQTSLKFQPPVFESVKVNGSEVIQESVDAHS